MNEKLKFYGWFCILIILLSFMSIVCPGLLMIFTALSVSLIVIFGLLLLYCLKKEEK